MSDIIQQIEAAAALGAKATKRPWAVDPLKIGTPWNIESSEGRYDIAMTQQQVSPKDDPAQVIRHANAAYIVAAANLPLSAIAEELRRLREIEKAMERIHVAVTDLGNDNHARVLAGVAHVCESALAAKESRQ